MNKNKIRMTVIRNLLDKVNSYAGLKASASQWNYEYNVVIITYFDTQIGRLVFDLDNISVESSMIPNAHGKVEWPIEFRGDSEVMSNDIFNLLIRFTSIVHPIQVMEQGKEKDND